MRTFSFLEAMLFAVMLFVPTLLLAGEKSVVTEKATNRVANFNQGDLSGWEEKSFKGNSQYKFVEVKDNGQLIKVLRASTEGQASGLFKDVDIDLQKTPYLHWSWQVKNLLEGNDERSKGGDDYPARIYVVVSGGAFFWNTKAINYVWSSNQPQGSEWPNAYTSNAKMIAVQTGKEKVGQWVKEKRNVREDLKRLFGDDLTQIDAIAVMVDGDNTGQSATSFFGDIYFSSE